MSSFSLSNSFFLSLIPLNRYHNLLIRCTCKLFLKFNITGYPLLTFYNLQISDARYLVCPAAFSVGNLKKFIRMKFDLKPKYEVRLLQYVSLVGKRSLHEGLRSSIATLKFMVIFVGIKLISERNANETFDFHYAYPGQALKPVTLT